MKGRVIITLLAITLFAFFLRVAFLRAGALTFGYDQARDAIISLKIAHGDLKILGPSSSTPGLYHGVLYYYVLAPAYLLGTGSPIVAAYWIAFLNSLVTVVCFALAYSFTKNLKTSFLAAVFFAISFEATQYATWLSNPTLGILTVPLLYLGLWYWIKGYRSFWFGPLLTGLALGASIQSEIFLSYHLIPVLIWMYISRKLITGRQVFIFVVSLLLAVSTLILSEVKFGFKGIEGLLSLLSSKDAIIASKEFGDLIILFFNQIGRVFAFSTYPSNIGYGAIIVFVSILFLVRNRKKSLSQDQWKLFLVTWLFSHITVVSLGGTSTPFLLVGIAPAVSILLAVTVSSLTKHRHIFGMLLFLVIVVGNLRMIMTENPKGQTLFAIQKDMTIAKEIDVINYTYKEASGAPFSINTLTSPLWVNIVWAYLYNWYGADTFGYSPSFTGHGQEGQLVALSKPTDTEQNTFLILEPLNGIPMEYLPLTIGEEDVRSKVQNEVMFGTIRVQKRTNLYE